MQNTAELTSNFDGVTAKCVRQLCWIYLQECCGMSDGVLTLRIDHTPFIPGEKCDIAQVQDTSTTLKHPLHVLVTEIQVVKRLPVNDNYMIERWSIFVNLLQRDELFSVVNTLSGRTAATRKIPERFRAIKRKRSSHAETEL